MIGLRNLGNTCFLNAVIQSLLASDLPKTLVSPSYDYQKHINKVNFLGTKGLMVESFVHLVKNVENATHGGIGFVSPVDFKVAVGLANPVFQGYRQHDSAEFLTFLLDSIHEDLNDGRRDDVRPKPLTKEQEEQEEKLPPLQQAVNSWTRFSLLNKSPVTDIFAGQLGSTITCSSCNYTSYSFSAFNILSLPIQSATLEGCVDHFMAPETLHDWKCPHCKPSSPQPSTKQLSISRYPENLIVQLKRFHGNGKKLDANVDFSLDAPFHLSKASYKIFAFIGHTGSLNFGHYKAYVKQDSNWIEADDVETHSISYPPKPNAYLLFFRKINHIKDEL